MSGLSAIAMLTAFAAGIVSFLSPRVLPLVPGYVYFTRRFLPYFEDITCVEASDVAVDEAKKKLGDKVKFVNSLFEKAILPKRYDNIVLTHVLETATTEGTRELVMVPAGQSG